MNKISNYLQQEMIRENAIGENNSNLMEQTTPYKSAELIKLKNKAIEL
jgi:hypothetical protein